MSADLPLAERMRWSDLDFGLDPYTATVDGCSRELGAEKAYLQRYSVCEQHFKADAAVLHGQEVRFCQQCNKFQDLREFEGARRSCAARSKDRNMRRRQQTTGQQKGNSAGEHEPAQQQSGSGPPGCTGSDDSGANAGSGDVSMGGNNAAGQPRGNRGADSLDAQAAVAAGAGCFRGQAQQQQQQQHQPAGGIGNWGRSSSLPMGADAITDSRHQAIHRFSALADGPGGLGMRLDRAGRSDAVGQAASLMGAGFNGSAGLGMDGGGLMGDCGRGGGSIMMDMDGLLPAAADSVQPLQPYVPYTRAGHGQPGHQQQQQHLDLRGPAAAIMGARGSEPAPRQGAKGGGDTGGWSQLGGHDAVQPGSAFLSQHRAAEQQRQWHGRGSGLLDDLALQRQGPYTSTFLQQPFGGQNGRGEQQLLQPPPCTPTLGGGSDGAAMAILQQLQAEQAEARGARGARSGRLAVQDGPTLLHMLGPDRGSEQYDSPDRGSDYYGSPQQQHLHQQLETRRLQQLLDSQHLQPQSLSGQGQLLQPHAQQDNLALKVRERRALLLQHQQQQQQQQYGEQQQRQRQQQQQPAHYQPLQLGRKELLQQETLALLAAYEDGPFLDPPLAEQQGLRTLAAGYDRHEEYGGGLPSSANNPLDFSSAPSMGHGAAARSTAFRASGPAAHPNGTSSQPTDRLGTLNLLDEYAFGGTNGAGTAAAAGPASGGSGSGAGFPAPLDAAGGGGAGVGSASLSPQGGRPSGGDGGGGDGGGDDPRFDGGAPGGSTGMGGGGGPAGSGGAGSGGSSGLLAGLLPGAGGRDDALVARVCLKLFSAMPEDLPVDLLHRMRRWAVTAEADVMQVFMRPGCVHLIANVRHSGGQAALERHVLGGGELEAAVAALRDAFDSCGLLRNRRVVVQAAEGPRGAFEYVGTPGQGQARWLEEEQWECAPSVESALPAALVCGTPSIALLAGRNLLRPGTRFFARCGSRSLELQPLPAQPAFAAASGASEVRPLLAAPTAETTGTTPVVSGDASAAPDSPLAASRGRRRSSSSGDSSAVHSTFGSDYPTSQGSLADDAAEASRDLSNPVGAPASAGGPATPDPAAASVAPPPPEHGQQDQVPPELAPQLGWGFWSPGSLESILVHVPPIPRQGLVVLEAVAPDLSVMGAWAGVVACEDAVAAAEINSWAQCRSDDATSTRWMLSELGLLLDYDATLPPLLEALSTASRLGEAAPAPAPAAAPDTALGSQHQQAGGVGRMGAAGAGAGAGVLHLRRTQLQPPQGHAYPLPLALGGRGVVSAVHAAIAGPLLGLPGAPSPSSGPEDPATHALYDTELQLLQSIYTDGFGEGPRAAQGASAQVLPAPSRRVFRDSVAGAPHTAADAPWGDDPMLNYRTPLSDDTIEVPDAAVRPAPLTARARLLSHPLLHDECRRAMEAVAARLLAFASASGLPLLSTALLNWLATKEGLPVNLAAPDATDSLANAEAFRRVQWRVAAATAPVHFTSAALSRRGALPPALSPGSVLGCSSCSSSQDDWTSSSRPSPALGLGLLHLAVASGSRAMVLAALDWADWYGRPWSLQEATAPGRATVLHLAAGLEDGGDIARLLLSLGPDAQDAWLALPDALGRTPAAIAGARLAHLAHFCLEGEEPAAADDGAVQCRAAGDVVVPPEAVGAPCSAAPSRWHGLAHHGDPMVWVALIVAALAVLVVLLLPWMTSAHGSW